MTETSERDRLLEAVNNLTTEVRGLRTMLHREYPKRGEMRRIVRSRVFNYFLVAILVLLAAQAMTMTTISHCFLNASVSEGAPVGCSAMPGYDQAVNQNQTRLGRFYELSDQIERNRLKTAELELEIEKLKQNKQQ